jgi:hypothetical protein
MVSVAVLDGRVGSVAALHMAEALVLVWIVDSIVVLYKGLLLNGAVVSVCVSGLYIEKGVLLMNGEMNSVPRSHIVGGLNGSVKYVSLLAVNSSSVGAPYIVVLSLIMYLYLIGVAYSRSLGVFEEKSRTL